MVAGQIFPGRCISIGEPSDEAMEPHYVGRLGFVRGPTRPYETVGDTEDDPLWRVTFQDGDEGGFWTEELTHPRYGRRTPRMDHIYFTNCTLCDNHIDALDRMIDDREEVTYKEMLERCVGLLEWSESVGYDPYCGEGLALEDDRMVDYCKSTWEGEVVYFVCWSAIEFIWKENKNATEEEKHDSIQKAREEGDRIIHPTANTFGRSQGIA